MDLKCYVGGEAITSGQKLEVRNPYNGERVGTVVMAGREEANRAVVTALSQRGSLNRYERYQILEKARELLQERVDEFSQIMTSESGLCVRETRYEVGRVLDVLRFSAMEALKDDGEIFSCDVSANGKARKIFSIREPLDCAVAITPFNHPLNQVAHKVAPAIAAGTPIVLKPSEKTPLSALKFAALLYEAGLPGQMLSVLLGPSREVAEVLVQDARVSLVSFTGSVAVGKRIASSAGYKKIILELGGNDPLIVLADADLDFAVGLAAEGSFRNSGQRCTAIKRILVDNQVAEEFTKKLAEKAKEYPSGDPFDDNTRVGTVIDETSAIYLETVVKEAVEMGAKILHGGNRRGALMEPTVIAEVPRNSRMVVNESFGPLAPVLRVNGLEDAIAVANSTAYGLSAGVVTNNLGKALQAIRELRCGMVNINELPAFRIESSPFGGIKDSGLGIKEGVIEAVKCFSTVKTFSLPWG